MHLLPVLQAYKIYIRAVEGGLWEDMDLVVEENIYIFVKYILVIVCKYKKVFSHYKCHIYI